MKLPLDLDRPVIFFDLETTGLSLSRDRIVELAVLRVSPQGDVFEKVRRYNPEIPIPPEAAAIHGITDEVVADEHPFRRTAKSLATLLEPCDLAGFNIRRFDLPILLAEFRRAGVAFDVKGRLPDRHEGDLSPPRTPRPLGGGPLLPRPGTTRTRTPRWATFAPPPRS